MTNVKIHYQLHCKKKESVFFCLIKGHGTKEDEVFEKGKENKRIQQTLNSENIVCGIT